MNKVVLIGRLTKDPELKYTAGSGTAVTRFTLAVDRRGKKDAEKPEADFISCVAFNKTAETIAQYLGKGRLIGISGNIRTGSYQAQDGSKRYTTDVWVEEFQFLDKGNGNSNNASSGNSGFGSDSFDMEMTPVDDGDIPF